MFYFASSFLLWLDREPLSLCAWHEFILTLYAQPSHRDSRVSTQKEKPASALSERWLSTIKQYSRVEKWVLIENAQLDVPPNERKASREKFQWKMTQFLSTPFHQSTKKKAAPLHVAWLFNPIFSRRNTKKTRDRSDERQFFTSQSSRVNSTSPISTSVHSRLYLFVSYYSFYWFSAAFSGKTKKK